MPSKMGKYSVKIMAMLWFSSLRTLHEKEKVILAIHLHLRESKKKPKKGACTAREVVHFTKISINLGLNRCPEGLSPSRQRRSGVPCVNDQCQEGPAECGCVCLGWECVCRERGG